MTAGERDAVHYHSYGAMGMFRAWLFEKGSMTSAEMSASLFERTPDFLKKAYATYPYSTEDILSRTGKETRRARDAGQDAHRR